MVFTHDIPQPYYKDNLIVQFTDDEIYCVRSDTVGPNKAVSAISKLKRELIRTLEWEDKCCIKTTFDKCSVGYSVTSLLTLENAGRVTVRGNPIQKNNIKLLGYFFSNLLSDTIYVNY